MDQRKRWPGAVAPEDGRYLGSEMDADVYRDRESGQVFHIGSALTNSQKPVRYDGKPSRLGYLIGSFLGGPKRG